MLDDELCCTKFSFLLWIRPDSDGELRALLQPLTRLGKRGGKGEREGKEKGREKEEGESGREKEGKRRG